MDKQYLYHVAKYDYVLAGIILLFSISSVIPLKSPGFSNEKKALIYKNNNLIKEINLAQKKTINIDKMELEVKEGSIRVLKSDCPRKFCKHTGWIKNPAQTIICVPNKILIEIVGISDDVEYNAVSYETKR